MKLNQIKSNKLNEFYNPEKDSRYNHIVEPPRLPIGHPLHPSSSIPLYPTGIFTFVLLFLFIFL